MESQTASGYSISTDYGIRYFNNFTYAPNFTSNNYFEEMMNGVVNFGINKGMYITGNTFKDNQQDVHIISGGVAPVHQGINGKEAYNRFSTICSPETHWKQDAGVSAVDYRSLHYYNLAPDGYPRFSCRTNTGSNQITVTGDRTKLSSSAPSKGYCSGGFYSPPMDDDDEIINALDSIGLIFDSLPASMSFMDSNQLIRFYNLRATRNYFVEGLLQNLLNDLDYDSVNLMINTYPCLNSTLKKLSLNIENEIYVGNESLINNIATYYSDCDTGYCDTAMGNAAQSYYPIFIQLKKFNFSDSIISAYSVLLDSISGIDNYFGSMAEIILHAYSDSLFRGIIPFDKSFSDTTLFMPAFAVNFSNNSPVMGIKESKHEEWRIYPNPTKTAFTVSLPTSFKGNCTYSILSVQGKLIRSGSLSQKENTITVSHLPPGIYILQLNQGNDLLNIRLIKQ